MPYSGHGGLHRTASEIEDFRPVTIRSLSKWEMLDCTRLAGGNQDLRRRGRQIAALDEKQHPSARYWVGDVA